MAGQQTSFSNYITDELVLDSMTHYQLGLSWYHPDGSDVYVEDAQIIEENKPFVMSSNKDNESIPNFTFDSQSENEDDEDEDEDDDKNDKQKDNKNKNDDDEDDD